MVIEEAKGVPEQGINPQLVVRTWLRDNSIKDLYDQLKLGVLGQDEELSKAAILIYGFLVAMANNYFDKKFHFLLEGTSGCGKSTFAKTLSKILPCPVVVADSTALTPSGYRGADIADLINTDEVIKFYGCAILILDEADKLMQISHSSEGNLHLETLHSLLKLLDGGTIVSRNGDCFGCEKIMVIAMGAFEPLRRPQKEVAIRNIGFGVERPSEAARTALTAIGKNIDKASLLDFCGSEQFLGRFTTVLHFKKLEKEVFLQIAKEAEWDIREIYATSFLLSDEERSRLVDNAMSTPYGVRSIKSAVFEAFLESEAKALLKEKGESSNVGFDVFFEKNMERIMTA